MAELKRTLNLAQCVFFGVGSILGAGIYTLLGKVAGWSGNMVWLSFLLASFTAFCTAFSYAELSAALPKAGGEFEYAKKAMGIKIGIALGLIISLNGIISGATVSVGFAGYLSHLTGINTLIASLGIIGLVFFINASGIRQSSALNIVCTIIEVSGLLFVIYAAIPYIGEANYFETTEQHGDSGFLTAAALGFFAYIGFEEIVKLSEETRNPEKNIPRALFIANGIVAVIYILVAICAISVISWEQLSQSKSPLADIVGSRFGQVAVTSVSIIALFSTSNTILSNMLGSSRVLFNMSREIGWLSRFSHVSEKRRTPVAALVLILVLMCSFALIGEIETIARIATFFIFVAFLFVNIAYIVLRIKAKDMNRPYKAPFNIGVVPVPAILAIMSIIILIMFNVYALV